MVQYIEDVKEQWSEIDTNWYITLSTTSNAKEIKTSEHGTSGEPSKDLLSSKMATMITSNKPIQISKQQQKKKKKKKKKKKERTHTVMNHNRSTSLEWSVKDCSESSVLEQTWFEPPHDNTNKMACAPSEDSDQAGHPPSLTRVFAVRMKKAWVLSYPLSAQRRLWSDWVDAQAELSLRWAYCHFVGFVMRRLVLIVRSAWRFSFSDTCIGETSQKTNTNNKSTLW